MFFFFIYFHLFFREEEGRQEKQQNCSKHPADLTCSQFLPECNFAHIFKGLIIN
jgi:hypothetical protein